MNTGFGSANSNIEHLKTQKTMLEKDYTALTVYIDSGCVGCNDFMLILIFGKCSTILWKKTSHNIEVRKKDKTQ